MQKNGKRESGRKVKFGRRTPGIKEFLSNGSGSPDLQACVSLPFVFIKAHVGDTNLHLFLSMRPQQVSMLKSLFL